MTTNDLRIALLTKMGWKRDADGNWVAPADWPRGWNIGPEKHGPSLDHNLIAQARQLLVTTDQQIVCSVFLAKLVGPWMFAMLNAAPEQHAEAILKALS
jgi:hypothetical protein